ncbi:acetyltransferase, GNAT family [Microbacterium esteraromaticum]|uniref:Acetyltransferase, GNAT family n=1 Tax=Microbacterium esteraromaticum TaxID=57043 RepID=A0A1R4KEW1_9MICO|nr:hypothetical protein [Microbacterium esteraromaticum]SJN42533.1 acetyltransferase, GNAT family [Microbacterium esteraromaticum]
MHGVAEIMQASAAWVWFPRGGEEEVTDVRLVRYPARLGGGVRISQVKSARDAAAVLDDAIKRTRAWGEKEITFWTNSADEPDLEPELIRRGAVHVDTVAVFARPVEGLPIEVPRNITAELVHTIEQVREVDTVNVPVWDQQPLNDEGMQEELAEVTTALASGEGARVLARLDGVPVSTGGCTIVDGFVRLWGAATLPEARGRGAYRAVLAERLVIGAAMGATTALVKGRHATSAPILARAGFQHFGDERGYALAVS